MAIICGDGVLGKTFYGICCALLHSCSVPSHKRVMMEELNMTDLTIHPKRVCE